MKSTPKVIWFISKYAVTPEFGNPNRQYFISKYIAKKGFYVTLISSQSSNIKIHKEFTGDFYFTEADNFKHFLLKGPKINLGFSFRRLWSWIFFEWSVLKLTLFGTRLNKPDVVIVSSLSLLTLCSGILLKWRYNAKLIVEIRDIWPLTVIEIGAFKKYNPLIVILGIIEKIGYKYCDAIVGTMPNLKEHVTSIIKKNIPVYCIPQGYDNEIFNHSISESTQNKIFSIRDDTFNVAYAGTFGNANNIDLILETAQIFLKNKNKNVHFYLIGDGPLKNNFTRQSLNLTNVTFMESVPPKDLPNFLKNFHLLLCPVMNHSIYRFGISPNKIIDYMRSGRPILISYNGYPSFIHSEEYIFTSKAENAELFASKILEVKNIDKLKLDLMGAKGKEIVEKYYTFDFLSGKYIDIINGF
jgi:glycosyltransferase involved in cell wall biosynthesis